MLLVKCPKCNKNQKTNYCQFYITWGICVYCGKCFNIWNARII